MRTRRSISTATWALAAALPLAAGAASAWRTAAVPTSRRALDAISEQIATTVRDLETAPVSDKGVIDRFASNLAGIEGSLTTIARSIPLDARALQLLACVRWERENLATQGPSEATLGLIDIAAMRAPRFPDVLLGLAATLFRMGETERGTALVARVVAEAPGFARRGVQLMLDSGIQVGTVASALPRTPAVVASLRDSMLEARLDGEFLTLAEGALADAHPALLESYGEVCLRTSQPARLLAAVDALPTSSDEDILAERDCQRGYAKFALGRAAAAADELVKARRHAPGNARYAEILGAMRLEAGDVAGAESAYREALMLLARTPSLGAQRARAYRGLARALSAASKTDQAIDATRRATEIEMAEPR